MSKVSSSKSFISLQDLSATNLAFRAEHWNNASPKVAVDEWTIPRHFWIPIRLEKWIQIEKLRKTQTNKKITWKPKISFGTLWLTNIGEIIVPIICIPIHEELILVGIKVRNNCQTILGRTSSNATNILFTSFPLCEF